MFGFDQFAKKNLLLIVACVAFYLINLNFLSKALNTYNLQIVYKRANDNQMQ